MRLVPLQLHYYMVPILTIVIHYLIHCSTDYINEQKLAQDHPCVIELIRNMYMSQPSPRHVPYNLTDIPTFNFTTMTLGPPGPPGYHPGIRNGSDMEAFLLKNKVSIFTVFFIF